MIALSVDGLSKRYARYSSNLERFATWFGAKIQPAEEFWPVRDVSFTVDKGKALAIIGQNGAGKSTLLKLITGTVRPTGGSIAVFGKVGAILELGLGFNPDLTGRQNAYHAGGLMGLSTARLEELMPEIEAFAEIGEFFDQPFRVYSSGMQARLAFALVTADRPDVLIVDEVLSVGDSYFQHKSFDRIKTFKEQGSTIILVTHGLADVRALCERVILLDKGTVLKDGAPDEVVDYYNALIAAKENTKLTIDQRREKNGWLLSRSGTQEARISSIDLVDAESGDPVSTALVGQKLALRLQVGAEAAIDQLVAGLMLRDRTGHVVWGSNTWHTKQRIENLAAGEQLTIDWLFTCDLGPGSYSFSSALTNSHTHLDKNYEWSDNLLVFDVINADRTFFVGTTALDGRFDVVRKPHAATIDRVAMTTSCRDSDTIPKIARAGQVEQTDAGDVQIMHNGTRVVAGGYHGDWMRQIILDLDGHHEPQEELLFHVLLSHCRPDTVFVELGAFWSYYSLWYLATIEGSRAICVEPDPNNLDIGRRNAALNGASERIEFVQAWVGGTAQEAVEGNTETAGPLSLPSLNMDSVCRLAGDEAVIEIVHIDAQGAELDFLRSMRAATSAGKVRFLVASTHHHSISGSPTTHADCVAEIEKQGGTVLAEHSVEESFSGDGLIVAAFLPVDGNIVLPDISRNRPETSLFGASA